MLTECAPIFPKPPRPDRHGPSKPASSQNGARWRQLSRPKSSSDSRRILLQPPFPTPFAFRCEISRAAEDSKPCPRHAPTTGLARRNISILCQIVSRPSFGANLSYSPQIRPTLGKPCQMLAELAELGPTWDNRGKHKSANVAPSSAKFGLDLAKFGKYVSKLGRARQVGTGPEFGKVLMQFCAKPCWVAQPWLMNLVTHQTLGKGPIPKNPDLLNFVIGGGWENRVQTLFKHGFSYRLVHPWCDTGHPDMFWQRKDVVHLLPSCSRSARTPRVKASVHTGRRTTIRIPSRLSTRMPHRHKIAMRAARGRHVPSEGLRPR